MIELATVEEQTQTYQCFFSHYLPILFTVNKKRIVSVSTICILLILGKYLVPAPLSELCTGQREGQKLTVIWFVSCSRAWRTTVMVTPPPHHHTALLLSLFVSKLPALVLATQLVRSVERRIMELNELLRRLYYTEEHSQLWIYSTDFNNNREINI